MQAVASFDSEGRWRSPLVSLVLHLIAGAALLFVPITEHRGFQPPEPLPVQIVSPQQFEAMARPVAPRVTAGRPEAPPSPPMDRPAKQAAFPDAAPQAQSTESAPMVRSQHMLSEAALAGPRSRKARAQLRTMVADERAVQICNIEAMQQIHAWKSTFQPQAVAPYAMGDLKIRGGSILAEGAAFYSGHDWYRLRFECGVQADRLGEKVASFAFSVGETIPLAEWEEHNLVEQEDDDDD